ncbi:MAG: hypothetical protein U5Q03_11575 [Bacteroidota bacterium]|nr:hypothetical protein [Bacteroidota bacterium]
MRKRKKKKLLLSQWGKPKDQYRDMDLISAYFDSSRESISDFYINDRTWNDLDMDQVFEKIDRCESRIGQQKLYQLLRIQKEEKSELTSLETLIDHFNSQEAERVNTQLILGRLDNFSFYSLNELFSGRFISKPRYHAGFIILSLCAIALIIACLIIPSLIWLLTVLLLINFSVHYIIKAKIGSYMGVIR